MPGRCQPRALIPAPFANDPATRAAGPSSPPRLTAALPLRPLWPTSLHPPRTPAQLPAALTPQNRRPGLSPQAVYSFLETISCLIIETAAAFNAVADPSLRTRLVRYADLIDLPNASSPIDLGGSGVGRVCLSLLVPIFAKTQT